MERKSSSTTTPEDIRQGRRWAARGRPPPKYEVSGCPGDHACFHPLPIAHLVRLLDVSKRVSLEIRRNAQFLQATLLSQEINYSKGVCIVLSEGLKGEPH
jgi:hypothetical protein